MVNGIYLQCLQENAVRELSGKINGECPDSRMTVETFHNIESASDRVRSTTLHEWGSFQRFQVDNDHGRRTKINGRITK